MPNIENVAGRTGRKETAMARHMMHHNLLHNDMAHCHTALSYYAGTESYFWGFYWYAYFAQYRYRLKRVNTALL